MMASTLLSALANHWGLYLLLISALYVGGGTAYNLFWHPLAKVPGPFVARVSALPSFYHACKGDRHIWIWQLFQIYGKQIRCQPNNVLWNSPTAYNDIYNMKANVQKSKAYTAWLKDKRETNTLFTVDVALHARRRRVLNQVFTEKSIRAAGAYITRHVDRWNELLLDKKDDGDRWSRPRNLSEWFDALSFEILADLCFGKSFEIKEPGENPMKIIPRAIAKYVHFTYCMTRLPFLDLLIWSKPRGLNQLLKRLSPPEVQAYYRFVDENVTNRLQLQKSQKEQPEKEQRLDMFHFLCEANDPETDDSPFTEQDLRSEANLLIIAGSDTTATSLCGFFFYLTRNPRQYSKLVHEIRTTFQTPEEIVGGARLSSCRYLRACIDESMRMAPVGPSEIPREVRPGGLTVDGEYIPAGITVGTVPWVTTHNEEIYPDYAVFRPERWIPNEITGVTEEEVASLKATFHPFSQGPSNCVGKNMALLEMMVTIARTLHRLDVRKAPGSTVGEGAPELGWGRRDRRQYQLKDAYISVRDGPVVQFKRRLP